MTMEVSKRWYVELEPGVWLAEGEGDPPRTINFQFAASWWSLVTAQKHLAAAREFRPFTDAQLRHI